MAKIITASTLMSRRVTARDRILLLNPPVEDTRYNWVRWNQPLDLLKIASRLRSRVRCAVELVDCMKPDPNGKVQVDSLPRDRRTRDIKGDLYPMRRFGMPYSHLAKQLALKAVEKKRPTQVWITSLCSYWFDSVAEVCRIVRQALPDAKIILIGQYGRLLPKDASQHCVADYVVSKPADLSSEPAAFDLYGSEPPPFLALQLNPKVAVEEVNAAVNLGTMNFTFFEEQLLRDEGEPLLEILAKTRGRHPRLRYHLICGLEPRQVTPAVAAALADPQVAEAHFEEAEVGRDFDGEAYRKVRACLREVGVAEDDNRFSGFVWIGRPGDQLENLVLRSFQVLDALRGLILKPFTPTPGSLEQRAHEKYLTGIPHREWSPHFFPFAELNGITRKEYHDLYRMAAFLNEKIRDQAFDFLKGTLGAEMLRTSLERKVWTLGPSPLRIID